jgi:predicted MFS family arabinose efflux permease
MAGRDECAGIAKARRQAWQDGLEHGRNHRLARLAPEIGWAAHHWIDYRGLAHSPGRQEHSPLQPSLSSSLDTRPARLILILALAPAVGVGLCRFAYSLLLPDMRDSLGWSYATAGSMNTANAAGYLSGALVASFIIRRAGLFRSVWVGTVVCVVSLVLSAMTANVVLLGTVRFLSGVAGAISFIAASALATNIAQSHPARLGFLMGLLYTGPGIGIFISGLTVPFLLQGLGPGSWWMIWGVLAAISAVLSLALPLARAAPVGASGNSATRKAPLRPMLIYLVAYFLYGAGSIAYMTFMIAFVRDAGGGALLQSAFWSLIAIGAFVSPSLWGGVIGRSRGGGGTAIVTAVTAVGALIPFLAQTPLALALSALIFGGAFFAVTSSTTAFVRFNYPAEAWPKAIAVLTVAFGLGQMLGPVATGIMTDLTGDLKFVLAISAAMLALGAAVAAWQRPLAFASKQ